MVGQNGTLVVPDDQLGTESQTTGNSIVGKLPGKLQPTPSPGLRETCTTSPTTAAGPRPAEDKNITSIRAGIGGGCRPLEPPSVLVDR